MIATWSYRLVLALILALVFYYIYPNSDPNPRPSWWNIEIQNSQVSVLNLNMHQSTLDDVSKQLQVKADVAMFTKRTRKDEAPAALHLEAYLEDLYDEGDRVIFGLDASDELLALIKKEAFEPQLFPNDVIRIGISPSLSETMGHLTIRSITVIAGWQVVFEEFKEKFGEPAQFLNDGQGNAHFLSPAMGLDFIQPADGLQILQFVAPDKFEETLLRPLLEIQKQGH